MITANENNMNRTIIQDESELKGWLLVLSGHLRGKDYPLFDGKNIIGSSHYADIHLAHENLEHFHFSIRFQDDQVWLTDFDTSTGITLEKDPAKVFRVELADETRFTTGGIDFLIKTLQLPAGCKSMEKTQTAKPGQTG